jgi:hypothetical protein
MRIYVVLIRVSRSAKKRVKPPTKPFGEVLKHEEKKKMKFPRLRIYVAKNQAHQMTYPGFLALFL